MAQPQYIGSGSSNKWGSNFYGCDVALRAEDAPVLARVNPRITGWLAAGAVHFPSSEHAWQALKAIDETTFRRFAEGGDLAVLDYTFWARLGHTRANAEKKAAHWAKGNLVGIVAKMAVNPNAGARLRLGRAVLDYSRERLTPDAERAVWLVILRAKFRSAALARQLTASAPAQLVELDRHARQHGSHWGGIVEDDGRITGTNAMGEYVMKVRAELLAEGEALKQRYPEVADRLV